MLSEGAAGAMLEQSAAVLRRIAAIAGSGYASAAMVLAETINHERALQQKQIATRIEAGAALSEMRRSVPHGDFEQEVRRATGLHPRTARNWRLLAEFVADDPASLPLILECRTVTAALALIRQIQGRRAAPRPPARPVETAPRPSITEACRDIARLAPDVALALARVVAAKAELEDALHSDFGYLTVHEISRLTDAVDLVTNTAEGVADDELHAMVGALGGTIPRDMTASADDGTTRFPGHPADTVHRVSISLFAESVDGGSGRNGPFALVAAARHGAGLVERIARAAPQISEAPTELLVGGYVAGGRPGRLTAALVAPFTALCAVIPSGRSSAGIPRDRVMSHGLIWGEPGDDGTLVLGLPSNANLEALARLGACIRFVEDPASDTQCRQLINAALAEGGDAADVATALRARDWGRYPLVESLRCRSLLDRWAGQEPPPCSPRRWRGAAAADGRTTSE